MPWSLTFSSTEILKIDPKYPVHAEMLLDLQSHTSILVPTKEMKIVQWMARDVSQPVSRPQSQEFE